MAARAGSNWVDPPKRERKRVVNYAENEYFRQAMKAGGAARGGGPRLPKMPQLQARLLLGLGVERMTEMGCSPRHWRGLYFTGRQAAGG